VVGVSKQIEQNPSRVSFDPGKVDIEALDDVADERDMSRAELIRDTLAELVEDYKDDEDLDAELHRPEHPELREAFEALLDLSDHPHGPRPVSVEEARSFLHSQTCPKAQVSDRLLRPLEAEGFITVRAGRIAVHRRTTEQVEAAEAEAEEQAKQIGIGHTLPSQNDIPDEQKAMRKYRRADLNVPFRLVAWTARNTLWSDNRGASA
jgi:hypothetical protein